MADPWPREEALTAFQFQSLRAGASLEDFWRLGVAQMAFHF